MNEPSNFMRGQIPGCADTEINYPPYTPSKYNFIAINYLLILYFYSYFILYFRITLILSFHWWFFCFFCFLVSFVLNLDRLYFRGKKFHSLIFHLSLPVL